MNLRKIFRQVIVTLLVVTSMFIVNGMAYADAAEDILKYTEQIAQNPNDADAYYNRGNAYYDLGQYERAIQDYDKAIELNPK